MFGNCDVRVLTLRTHTIRYEVESAFSVGTADELGWVWLSTLTRPALSSCCLQPGEGQHVQSVKTIDPPQLLFSPDWCVTHRTNIQRLIWQWRRRVEQQSHIVTTYMISWWWLGFFDCGENEFLRYDKVLLGFVSFRIGDFSFCLYCSWEDDVRVLGIIRNDEKSMWLVGESEGQVHIGFIVSF